jgi:alkanesulfonate monooxygenase SsuD/methylene tetrahydromethanopterin reductase-like flavin-dependent oxidoreductase (luciferase family)
MSQTETLAAPPTAQSTKLKLGFLTNGAFTADAPGGAAQGHKEVVDLFRQAESLGYDRGWVRNRHFDNYLSSPLSVIVAAAARTERIELGTAIIPVGYENPVRLAEDAATTDLLIDNRLQLGIATGIPGFDAIFGLNDPRPYKVSAAEKVNTFLAAIDGTVLGYSAASGAGPAVLADPELGRFSGPAGESAPGQGIPYYVRPHSPTLRGRIWYGPGSVETAAQAARQGLDLLLSAIAPNVGLAFDEAQRAQIDAHAAAWTRTDRGPRVSAARLFFPFVNDRQRKLYQDYADLRAAEGPAASRPGGSLPPRTAEDRAAVAPPKAGPGLMSPVVVAEPAEVIEYLRSDAAVQASGELMIFLPPGFSHRENLELIENISGLVAGELGWRAAR